MYCTGIATVNNRYNIIYKELEHLKTQCSGAFYKEAHCVPLFCNLFCLGKNHNPSPAALLKARIVFRWVFIMTPGSSLPDPRRAFSCMWDDHSLSHADTLWIKKCTLTSFVTLGLQSEWNAPKNGEPPVGFPFLAILRHTGWFWSRIY